MSYGYNPQAGGWGQPQQQAKGGWGQPQQYQQQMQMQQYQQQQMQARGGWGQPQQQQQQQQQQRPVDPRVAAQQAEAAAVAALTTPEQVSGYYTPKKEATQKQLEQVKEQTAALKEKTGKLSTESEEERQVLEKRRLELDAVKSELADHEKQVRPGLDEVNKKETEALQKKRTLDSQINVLQNQVAACQREIELAPSKADMMVAKERGQSHSKAARDASDILQKRPSEITAPATPAIEKYAPPRWQQSACTSGAGRSIIASQRNFADVQSRYPYLKQNPNFRGVTFCWQNWSMSSKLAVPKAEDAKLTIPKAGSEDAPEPLKQPDELPVMPSDTPHIVRVVLLTRAAEGDGPFAHPMHGVNVVCSGLHTALLNAAKACVSELKQVDIYGGKHDPEKGDGDAGSEESLKRAALRCLKEFSGVELPRTVPLLKFMQVENAGKDGAVCTRHYFVADLTKLRTSVVMRELHREHTVTIESQRTVTEEVEVEQEIEDTEAAADEEKKEEGDEPPAKKMKTVKVKKTETKVVTDSEEQTRSGALVRPLTLSLHQLTQPVPTLTYPASFECRLVAHGLQEMLQHKYTTQLVSVLEGIRDKQAAKRKREEEDKDKKPEDAEMKAFEAAKDFTQVTRVSKQVETTDYEALKVLEFFDVPATPAGTRSGQLRASDLAAKMLALDRNWTLREIHTLLGSVGLDKQDSIRYRDHIVEKAPSFEKEVTGLRSATNILT